MTTVPMTVAETPAFVREAAAALNENERLELITFLAATPDAGLVIPGTGGVRKLRWASQGRGKRGGVRVIYYYHSEAVPLFLLTLFAKSEKANLTQSERNELRLLMPRLVAAYRARTRI